MGAASVARPIGGVAAIVGGIIILATWGLYVSLWSIVGLLLGVLAMFGGALLFKHEYVRGGTMSAAAAIICWGLYPTHPLSTILLIAVSLMAVGGVIGLILEMTAD